MKKKVPTVKAPRNWVAKAAAEVQRCHTHTDKKNDFRRKPKNKKDNPRDPENWK